MLPELKMPLVRSGQQTAFAGLNHTNGAGNGEIYDMTNLCGDEYPLLSSRKKRHSIAHAQGTPHGIYAAGSLFTVYGTKLYVDGAEKGTVTDTDKVFCALGERVVIFPDKVIYANGALSALESRWAGGSLTFKDGTYAGEDAQANTIYAAGINWTDYFKVGDAVTISGCTVHTENNRTSIIREIDGANLRFYENTFTLGEGETSYTETGTLKIERTVPDLDFLCSNENRIWGCKDDTICCCKLGDPFNWNVFDGLSTDAWSVESGKAGKFTGCVSYLGYPVFFKEDQIFKVYGSVPTNFQLMASATFGVMDGSAKSLAIAGEVLYYLSRVGIAQYSGGIPQIISEPLGTAHFAAGSAGSDGLKYYVTLRDGSGTYGLYVYDTQKRLWHKEDATRLVGAAYKNGLYAQTANGDILLLGDPPVVPDGASEETNVSSEAIFADFDFGTFDAKRVIRLNARIDVETGATVTAYISYDGEAWEAAGTVTATQKTVQELMLPIERGDHFRMKFNATGAWKLCALRYEYHDGGRK